MLSPIKSFKVFGEPVEVLVNGDMTEGLSATLLQTSPPGGGPPPHTHQNEDETFFLLEGEFEFLENGKWNRDVLRAGCLCAARRRTHLPQHGRYSGQNARLCSSGRHGKISRRNFRAVHAGRRGPAIRHL
jgi:hypothetical protein